MCMQVGSFETQIAPLLDYRIVARYTLDCCKNLPIYFLKVKVLYYRHN